MTEEERAYNRAYQPRWRRRRRKWMKAELGGKCVDCGTTRHLEFDHDDRTTKAIPSNHLMTCSMARLRKEMPKLKLRCRRCHRIKTALENQGDVRAAVHAILGQDAEVNEPAYA